MAILILEIALAVPVLDTVSRQVCVGFVSSQEHTLTCKRCVVEANDTSEPAHIIFCIEGVLTRGQTEAIEKIRSEHTDIIAMLSTRTFKTNK